MDKNIYVVVNRFNCCGKLMVTVIIKGKSASVMPESEYNRIIENEQKCRKNNKLKKTA